MHPVSRNLSKKFGNTGFESLGSEYLCDSRCLVPLQVVVKDVLPLVHVGTVDHVLSDTILSSVKKALHSRTCRTNGSKTEVIFMQLWNTKKL